MRLTHIVLVAVASIFACCEGASAVSDSTSLTVPQSHVQTKSNSNQLLRVHQDAEEERAGPQLTKSLSEKLLTKTAAKLKRSKSLEKLVKLDDEAMLKVVKDNSDYVLERFVKQGIDPDDMLLKMERRGNIDDIFLQYYTDFWKEKFPTWVTRFKTPTRL